MNLFLILSSLAFLVALFVLPWLHSQYRLALVVKPAPPPDDPPRVSVLVPARNEGRNIRRCVEALLAQDYPNLEIIVLDDRSTDETPHILANLSAQDDRLKVIRGRPLPPGWVGKPHALHQAAAAASGAWLLFLDADTFLVPNAVSAALRAALASKADLFSVMTRQEMGSFWEKVVLPLVFTALSVGFSPQKVNDPARPDAIANGQFILMPKTVYQAVGGHEAVRASVVEDKDLATLVKRSGYRLVLADGQAIATTRMYTSLPEMWEGWTKNIYLGLRDDRGLLLLGIFGAFLAIMAALGMLLWLLGGLWWWLHDGGLPAAIVTLQAAIIWGWMLWWRVQAARGMGISGWYALTTPLGAGVFAAMMLTSAFNVLSGRGVRWKGRRYGQRKETKD